MSAITGIFYRDGRNVDLKSIELMNDRLSHRGVDGSRVWVEGSVALGHLMLHTTSESLYEKLPFEDVNSDLVITADARIDNRKELSKELNIEDKVDVPDSFFILKAYEMWGEKSPEHLLGDFAFSIWDKNKEKLFCARDYMGVKPFYYYLSDKLFIFATEMKALFSIQEVPNEINELKVAFHLKIISTDKKFTFYKDIFPLTSAHSLSIGKNIVDKRKYWKLDPESQIIMDSDEEYIEKFRQIFAEAVNCRLRSAFPIGFELSGGMDSSSIVCMAKKITDEKNSQVDINTFSMIFDDFPEVDERHYIHKVIEKGGINPCFIPSDRTSPLENIGTIIFNQDQPFYTPNMTILWNMHQKMEDNNIRVLLSGNGGDEVISHGDNYIQELATSKQWKKLIREVTGYRKRADENIINLLLKEVFIPLAPVSMKTSIKNILISLNIKKFENEDIDVLDEEFIRSLDCEDYLKEINKESTIELADTARKYHHFIIDKSSHQYILEMIDRIASNFSIEPRYPFFDKRLIEFCYAIPDEMKFRYGWDRYIQRVALKDILPTEIQWRPLKKLFDPVFEKNFLSYEKDLLEEIIFDNNQEIEKYINLDLVKISYKEFISGSNNNSNRIHFISNYLWLIVLLYLWLQNRDLYRLNHFKLKIPLI